MEQKLMMPASYNVMSEEEMTYTEGGATTLQAVCAWLLPGYGYFRLQSDARAECQANPNGWLERLIDKKVADSKESAVNAIYNIGCAAWTAFAMVGSLGTGILFYAANVYI